MKLGDGGTYHPSKPQCWAWGLWEKFWVGVATWRDEHRADLIVVFNGDCVEGDHHATSQIISRNPEPQSYVAGRVFGVPMALKPSRVFIVRGTEAHVGPGGASEEALGRSLGAEKDPATDAWTHYHLRLALHGKLLDFQHHGRMGQRPWTKPSVSAYLAFNIWVEHTRLGRRPPDLAFRSHLHQFADSGEAWPTRVIQTPAFQLKTAHAHKVAAESIADLGGVMVLIEPSGLMAVRNVVYHPDPPAIL